MPNLYETLGGIVVERVDRAKSSCPSRYPLFDIFVSLSSTFNIFYCVPCQIIWYRTLSLNYYYDVIEFSIPNADNLRNAERRVASVRQSDLPYF